MLKTMQIPLVYQAEKALKELDGKGDTALLKEVEEAKDKLKKSIEAGKHRRHQKR